MLHKSPSIDDVLKALSYMSKEELVQVNNKLKFLLSTGGTISAFVQPNVVQEPKSDSELMLLVICDYFRDAGLESISPALLRKAGGYGAFKNKIDLLTTYFDRGAGPLQRTERQALFRVGVDLLYKNLVEMNIAVSTRTLLGHIHRIPAVINYSFPGYSNMSMLKIIIKRRSTA